ncbi:FecCD family ABC transporter permease [Desulfurispira natronophila]|uniref:Iron complex transport system permease protein n=1 Tax=Desulfurispira natronophila TaxID=682562 RepID=A0A7W7Y517_9BACT|nr:iron ABC transporter permease [Desulfurispira natronophila]MBB5021927.1 iron complex transport system permease protein [Desulfurispira natronophila]
MAHLQHGTVPSQYTAYLKHKRLFLLVCTLLCLVLLLAALGLGPAKIPPIDIIQALLGTGDSPRNHAIVWNMRLPHALAAVIAGAGLAAAGAAMQSILRNPLGSPFTLGISQAGAFGAALVVMTLGAVGASGQALSFLNLSQSLVTTLSAFSFCLVASLVIVALARLRGATPEVMVLAGVALGALFSAGTMFLQYFADDVQLAAIVFWTFGDVGRAGWSEVGIMGAVVSVGTLYFVWNRWQYNAIDAGDETARGLGVRVGQLRIVGMLVCSAITAVIVSFLGIIGFVGLISPHIVRRFIGDDHRFLMPASCLVGAALLLAADIVARLIMAPHVIPVSVLTAFIGAPAFIYLLIRRQRR